MCCYRAVALLGGLILFAGGCDTNFRWSGRANTAEQAGQKLSGVAVVDLDEVARRLGSDVAMVQAIRESQTSLNQQLQSLQTSLQQQYQRKKHELDGRQVQAKRDQATETKQLEAFSRQLSVQLNQARRNANNQINAHQRQLIQRFREEVKPVAQQAAFERGLGVVVTKNESVLLAFDDAHDITAAVVEKLQAQRAAFQGAGSQPVASRGAPPAETRR